MNVDPPNLFQNLIGNSINPAVNPEITMFPASHGSLTFLERIQSFLFDLFMHFMSIFYLKIGDFLLHQKFLNLEFSSQIDVAHKRVVLYYTFTSHITSPIRPTIPFYHQLGFVHLKPPREIMNQKVKNFLDNSSNGVIVMCFGSVAGELNHKANTTFVEAFKELPFNVIWKTDSKFDVPEKIMTVEWLQLDDILAHKNVKVLVAHAGLNTIEEAIDREVPMVLIPINYDQPFNALHQVEHKIAMELDLHRLTKESLKDAIMEMTQSKYKESIKIIREQSYDRMMSSLEEAVVNIEHVLKHKATYGFQSYALHYKYLHFFEIFHVLSNTVLKFIFSF
jgi:glucuronosyltransferase